MLRLLHDASRGVGFHVEEVEASLDRSYWEFRLVASGCEAVSVLVNRFHPIVAFVDPGSFPPAFVDQPALRSRFSADAVVLAAADANRAVVADDVAALGAVEIQQVRFWKPEKLGWIVFNWWD